MRISFNNGDIEFNLIDLIMYAEIHKLNKRLLLCKRKRSVGQKKKKSKGG